MLNLTIQGKVPAKSSSRQLIWNKRTGKPMIISSVECKNYERDFAWQVKSEHKNKFSPDDRLVVCIRWFSDSLRMDIDAPAKIIFDMLQKTEVIHNDNKIDYYQIERFIDKNNPSVEIRIIKKESDKR